MAERSKRKRRETWFNPSSMEDSRNEYYQKLESVKEEETCKKLSNLNQPRTLLTGSMAERSKRKRRETWFDPSSMEDSRNEYQQKLEADMKVLNDISMLEKAKKKRRETWFDPSTMESSRNEYQQKLGDSAEGTGKMISFNEDEDEDEDDSNPAWYGELDPNFDVQSSLLKKPSKNILKKNHFKVSKPVNSYRYEDSFNKIQFIIGGFSYSTFIRRILIHLNYVKFMMTNILKNNLVPNWDLEQHLFSTVQMTQDLFRNDLLPLVAYTIINKVSHKKEYGILIAKLLEINRHVMKYAFLNGNVITFDEPIRFSIYSDVKSNHFTYVSQRSHDDEVRYAENILLFITSSMFNLFTETSSFHIFEKMLDYLVQILSKKVDENVKQHFDEYETQNND